MWESKITEHTHCVLWDWPKMCYYLFYSQVIQGTKICFATRKLDFDLKLLSQTLKKMPMRLILDDSIARIILFPLIMKRFEFRELQVLSGNVWLWNDWLIIIDNGSAITLDTFFKCYFIPPGGVLFFRDLITFSTYSYWFVEK